MTTFIRRIMIFCASLLFCIKVMANTQYPVNYYFDMAARPGEVVVGLALPAAEAVKLLDFNLAHSQCVDFASEQSLERDGDRLLWRPGAKAAKLTFRCPIKHPRASRLAAKAYDAWWEESYALFRGDDMVPPARVVARKGAVAQSKLYFTLPEAWPHVNTGWQAIAAKELPKGVSEGFLLDNPERRFSRPTGWMIAGELGTRRDSLGTGSHTQLAVSAPVVADYSRMDALVLLNMLWPQLERAFQKLPAKILIVSSGSPLWRGGLSAGNSLYLHSGRPMVSENGSSTLIHELTHVITGIHATKKDDWIVEGIAEFYSSNLLLRAGGLTPARYDKLLVSQARRAGSHKDFRKAKKSSVVKAGAANFFDALDKSIRQRTSGKSSVDDVVQVLMNKGRVSLADLKSAVEGVAPESLAVFDTYKID
ncbi:hypothetical protein [Teredinibacter turnerae]|uniref:hypothetical protein n=1 Tax=Teredinibacter turnerae TaxID=2426 RepID=UPI001E5ECF1C|nr:hypothetical protein [Teredinibacter turnerae]